MCHSRQTRVTQDRQQRATNTHTHTHTARDSRPSSPSGLDPRGSTRNPRGQKIENIQPYFGFGGTTRVQLCAITAISLSLCPQSPTWVAARAAPASAHPCLLLPPPSFRQHGRRRSDERKLKNEASCVQMVCCAVSCTPRTP